MNSEDIEVKKAVGRRNLCTALMAVSALALSATSAAEAYLLLNQGSTNLEIAVGVGLAASFLGSVVGLVGRDLSGYIIRAGQSRNPFDYPDIVKPLVQKRVRMVRRHGVGIQEHMDSTVVPPDVGYLFDAHQPANDISPN